MTTTSGSPRKNSNLRLCWLLVVMAVLIVGAMVTISFCPSSPSPSFLTAKAVVCHMEDTVLATGELEAYRLVSVGAQASGQIKSLKVALGDKVKKGQLIAEIDSLTQQNTLKNAEAALRDVLAQRRAKHATLKQAENALRRQSQLVGKDAGSQQDYEDAIATRDVTQAGIEVLDAQIEQARISVSTAKVNLGYTKITAPMDGVVVAIITKEGQTVNASQSAPTIIKLAQLDKMTVEAEISEADVVRVKPGQKVYFTILGEPDHRYEATLRAIKPAPESITSDSSSTSSSGSSSTSSSSSSAIYYNGLFDIPNPDGKLRISMTAQCTIVLAEAPNAVCIPATALGQKDKQERYLVRVLGKNGLPMDRYVSVGINNGNKAQVLEGIAPGESVVIGQVKATSGESQENQTRRPPPMRL